MSRRGVRAVRRGAALVTGFLLVAGCSGTGSDGPPTPTPAASTPAYSTTSTTPRVVPEVKGIRANPHRGCAKEVRSAGEADPVSPKR